MKKQKKRRRSFFWIEASVIVILAVSSYFIAVYEKSCKAELKQDVFISDHEGRIAAVKSDNKEFSEINIDYDDLISDYRNILLVGVDARNQDELEGGSNADTIIICSINESNGEIKLVSVLRDTLLKLEDPGSAHAGRIYDKANSQLCYTDISDMVSMINKNLDLNIRDYAVVNWLAASKIFDTLGGIELELSDPDVIRYMNGYLTEVNKKTGMWSPQISETGIHKLTGTQCVALCRVRYAGLGDTGRTGNQRIIIEKSLEKLKKILKTNPAAAVTAVTQAVRSVRSDMGAFDIASLVLNAGDYDIKGEGSFPYKYRNCSYTEGVVDAIIPDSLCDNVVMLHDFLFPEASYAYEVPDYVRKISNELGEKQ